MLDLNESSLPAGGDDWNGIATTYNSFFGNGGRRSSDELRNKFKSLRNVKKPTDDPTCPPDVKIAMHIQKSIERSMDVQSFVADEEDENEEDPF